MGLCVQGKNTDIKVLSDSGDFHLFYMLLCDRLNSWDMLNSCN